MTINISIVDKRPTLIGAPVIVCGNSDYTIQFSFDAEWDAEGAKIARFVYVQRGAVKFQEVDFTGTVAEVPILSDIREVMVGVYAGDLRTTTPALIPCEKSILCDSGEEQNGNIRVHASGMFVPHLAEDGTLSWTNDQGLPNPDPINIMGPQGVDGTVAFEDLTEAQREMLRGPQGPDGTVAFEDLTEAQREMLRGPQGGAGVTFTPHLSDDGILSWTNDKELENPAPVNITGPAGEAGQRGTSLLPITTAPSTYTTAVNGLTPAYRVALSNVRSEASVSEVFAGDTLRYSYYHYPVIYVDASYVYCRTRVSIRGATGGKGETGATGPAGPAGDSGVYILTEGETIDDAPADADVVIDPNGEPDIPEGGTGENGATFTPTVAADGTLSWTNDKGLKNPAPVNIKPQRGVDYWTDADKNEIKSYVDEAILGGAW